MGSIACARRRSVKYGAQGRLDSVTAVSHHMYKISCRQFRLTANHKEEGPHISCETVYLNSMSLNPEANTVFNSSELQFFLVSHDRPPSTQDFHTERQWMGNKHVSRNPKYAQGDGRAVN